MTSIPRALRLVVLALLLAIPLPATAFQVTVGGITYELSTLETTYDASSAQLQLQPWWSATNDPASAQSFVDAFLAAGGNTIVDLGSFAVLFSFAPGFGADSEVIAVLETTSLPPSFFDSDIVADYVIASVVPAAVPEIDGNALARALFVLLAFGLWLRGRRRAA